MSVDKKDWEETLISRFEQDFRNSGSSHKLDVTASTTEMSVADEEDIDKAPVIKEDLTIKEDVVVKREAADENEKVAAATGSMVARTETNKTPKVEPTKEPAASLAIAPSEKSDVTNTRESSPKEADVFRIRNSSSMDGGVDAMSTTAKSGIESEKNIAKSQNETDASSATTVTNLTAAVSAVASSATTISNSGIISTKKKANMPERNESQNNHSNHNHSNNKSSTRPNKHRDNTTSIPMTDCSSRSRGSLGAVAAKELHAAAPALELAKNVYVVFPVSALGIKEHGNTLASASSIKGSVSIPYLTLHPNFPKEKGAAGQNGDIYLNDINRIFQVVSPSSAFLASDFMTKEWFDGRIIKANDMSSVVVEKNCLHRLHSLMNGAFEDKTASLLIAGLLMRVEVAICLAFREKQVANAKDHPKAKHSNKGGKNSSTNSRTVSSADLDTTGARLSHGTLPEIINQLETFVNDSRVLNKQQLREIFTPLTRTGYCSLDSVRHVGVNNGVGMKWQNLLLAPLPSLIRMVSNSCAMQRSAFDSFDQVWTLALQRIQRSTLPRSRSTSMKGKAPGSPTLRRQKVMSSSLTSGTNQSHSDSSEWMDSVTPSTAGGNSTPSSSSKNKKKKRKKKQKKKVSNANAGGAGASGNNSKSNNKQPETTESGNTAPVEKGADESADKNSTKNLQGKSTADANPTTDTNPRAINLRATKAESKKKIVKEEAETNADRNAKVVGGQASTSTNGSDRNSKPSTSDTAPVPASTFESAPTKSGSTERDNLVVNASKSKQASEFSVSRVHGVGTVVVAPSTSEALEKVSSKAEVSGTTKEGATASESHDDWETVEVKSKGNRKKSGRQMAHQASSLSNANNSGSASQGGGNRKSKANRPAGRKRSKNRIFVKEILSSVLDSVDVEVQRRRHQEACASNSSANVQKSVALSHPSASAWKAASSRTNFQSDGARNGGSLHVRNVGISRQAAVGQKRTKNAAMKNESAPTRQTGNDHSGAASATPGWAKDRNGTANPSSVKGAKGRGPGADQNTATTIPETVSAVSDSRIARPSTEPGVTRSDSSSMDTDSIRNQDRVSASTKAVNVASPAPPLPTLLHPGNANSSSSSVASSLEAPHAVGHGHRRHVSSSNEADVGYHLLDVCERLTRDMNIFMARRSTALSTRRRERGALLMALQESVSSIWSGHSHVELYGSCATTLDLPSSDLDVVVRGLDHSEPGMNPATPTPNNISDFSGSPAESMGPDQRISDPQLAMHHHGLPPFVHLQYNAERVLRLAAELERQPWAVHVKAIPTASVPVVKVLADPSRLPGAAPPSVLEGEEWMIQQHHAKHGTPARSGGIPSSTDSGLQGNAAQYQPAIAPVWRGADVINGLLKLDITFEGPEHGGIGSTEFSARVVHDMCNELGIPAESTPFVQVLMVLKELLAQRRLNEPFSGGLSSYALLLLVLAVVCERKVIREELDRVEKQRRAVAAGGCNSEVTGTPCGPEETIQAAVIVSPETQDTAANSNFKPAPSSKEQDNHAMKKNASSKSRKASPDIDGQFEEPNHAVVKRQGASLAQKSQQNVQSDASAKSPNNKETNPSSNSWASVAMGKNSASPSTNASMSKDAKTPQSNKPSSFADAVARIPPTSLQIRTGNAQSFAKTKNPKGQGPKTPNEYEIEKNKQHVVAATVETVEISSRRSTSTASDAIATKNISNVNTNSNQSYKDDTERKIDADEKTSKFNNYSSQTAESTVPSNQSVFPQGFNDIIEVLCSGETTPGKLLMHFLLFYGQHFDAHATAIDISGKHHRDIASLSPPYNHLSPYLQRRSAGQIDPITGMLTVDPIVVYDPLEGAENNNVARRCFLWSSVKWVFAQSYMTLSSAVERNTTPPGTPGSGAKNATRASNEVASSGSGEQHAAWNGPYNPSDRGGNLFDPSSPLLELLLSF